MSKFRELPWQGINTILMSLVALFGGLWAHAIKSDVSDVRAEIIEVKNDLKGHLVWSQSKSEQLERTATIVTELKDRINVMSGRLDPAPITKKNGD